ncbi:DNA cytosine methyltransferase [Clostridium estertheticum]|uniref:DNA cytosine methyltransferase n=1 Tax=Clostridium estertheticum TaxID=238834 RepID=UPI0021612657|nr:DNA cytosine methyltransferase [Clostridium estertheticum]
MDKPIALDIFCGAGGMSEGFIQTGFDVLFACDINESAELTYMNRHNQLGYITKFARKDIREFSEKKFLKDFLEGKKIDIVCGGPPCQGFSLAGKRDQNDPRNMLFKHYIKTIKNVQPNYFVMENVEGILSMQFDSFEGVTGTVYINKTVPEILIKEFFKIGYQVDYRVLQANDYGVPQYRKRVFFLGHKIKKVKGGKFKSVVASPNFPIRNVDKEISVKEAIDDLAFLESGNSSETYNKQTKLSDYQIKSINGRTPTVNGNPISSKILFNHKTSSHSKNVIERFSFMKEGESLVALRERLGPEIWKMYETKKLRCQKIRSGKPSPTVLTLPDDLVHYSKNRIMTVREFARLQSFDDSFQFMGKRTTGGDRRKIDLPQYSQVGNAVPPLMAKAVAMEILKAIVITEEQKI